MPRTAYRVELALQPVDTGVVWVLDVIDPGSDLPAPEGPSLVASFRGLTLSDVERQAAEWIRTQHHQED